MADSSLSLRDPARQVARLSAAALIALLTAAALLLAWRRLAGALNHPLQPAALALVGLLLAAAAAALRSLWRQTTVSKGTVPFSSNENRDSPQISLLISAVLVLLGISLCLGSGVVGTIIFCAILAGEEAWAWRPTARPRRCPEQPIAAAVPRLRIDAAQPIAPCPLSPSATPPENVLQQLTLSQDADGCQQLAGWLRVRLAAGQRTCAIHVAFCPPFAKTPELAVQQTAGPQSRIRTAQLLPYGVRLDLKLAAAATSDASVLLRFTARSPLAD